MKILLVLSLLKLVVCFDISEHNDIILMDDMLMKSHQFLAMTSGRKLGYDSAVMRWPNNTIPYMIDEYFNKNHLKMLHEAMDTLRNMSCVRFIPYEEEVHKDYIYIQRGTGCASHVGLCGGKQPVKLHPQGCFKIGILIHELMHSLGFLHMHMAPIRDEYIDINFENVQKSTWENFIIQTDNVSMFGTEYDYESLMHYESDAFAINVNIPTIIPKKPGAKNMGQRDYLSKGDILRINRMYKCPGYV